MNPRLKQVLTYAFCAAWAFFALLGLLVLPGVVEAIRQMPLKPACYFGAEACRQSRACAALPLPPQEQETERFPMAVEYPKLIGRHSRVLFRASAEWQDAFRRIHPGEKVSDHMPELLPEVEGEDKPLVQCIVSAREWHPFHEGRLFPGGQVFFARRDASGEYVLIDLID